MTVPMLFANNASSRLYMAIDASTTSIRVMDGEGSRFPQPAGDGSNYFPVTVEDRRSGQIEIMLCTGRSYDILNVTRAQEGTPGQAFEYGATVSNRLTAATMDFLAHAGAQGPEGPEGPVGPVGPVGPQGAKGDTGADSTVQGPQGPPGAAGVPGLQGDPGPQGVQGLPGPQGSVGPAGPVGPTGAASSVPGPAGPEGAQGNVGPQGSPGPQGPAGPQGVEGPEGPQGNTGAASTVPGPTGPQGIQGPVGATGGQVMYIGDGPPASPVVGQTWWESDTGNSFVYYNDGNSSQWVPSHVGASSPVTGGKITIGNIAPVGPVVNDVWIDTT